MSTKYTTKYHYLDLHCRHCLEPLAAKYKHVGGPVLAGLVPLEYVHAETNKKECTRTYEAEPYDSWQASREWKTAHEDMVHCHECGFEGPRPRGPLVCAEGTVDPNLCAGCGGFICTEDPCDVGVTL